jgi:hypothetical protein
VQQVHRVLRVLLVLQVLLAPQDLKVQLANKDPREVRE